jgi:hypothetical protein
MDTLKNLLETAGYTCTSDNRNYAHKAVNNALLTGECKVELKKQGFVGTGRDGFKYNLRVSVGIISRIAYIRPSYYSSIQKRNVVQISAEDILTQLGKLLQNPEVKAALKLKKAEEGEVCVKCSGKGHIPAFSHVCQGVCFDCLGVGYRF